MELPSLDNADTEIELARKTLAEENFDAALAHLERALELNDNPAWYSYVGYCVARGRGDFRTAVELCRNSIEQEQGNPVHYENLGKVYLTAGNKEKAIQALREGMARGGNLEILAMLIGLGTRDTPVFRSLKRSNPLNKIVGHLLHRRNQRRRGLP